MSSRAVRLCLLGFSVALGGVVACSSDSTGMGVDISAVSDPANVAIDLRDGQGRHIGSCSGTLVSSSTVLTAGHCVVAAKQWVIAAPGADGQTAKGARVWTTWSDFQSKWTHPDHSDVGVILLDRPILLSRYPTIAGSIAEDGTRLSRMRRSDAYSTDKVQFEEVQAPAYQGVEKGFPLEYYSDAAMFETQVDTGGALIDPGSYTIYGVVSGKGLQSGRMYAARVDYLKEWIDSIASCSPPPQAVQWSVECHPDAGSSGSSGSSSGGSSSGSTSGGSSGGSSNGGSSSGGSGGSSGSGSSGWGSSSGTGSGSSGASSGGSSSGGGVQDGGSCNPPPPPPPPAAPSRQP